MPFPYDLNQGWKYGDKNLRKCSKSCSKRRKENPFLSESPFNQMQYFYPPLYLSQGPAAEMWSVVHFPLTLIRILMSVRSVPIHLSNGDRSWSLSELGETSTTTLLPSSGGASRIKYQSVKVFGLSFSKLKILIHQSECSHLMVCHINEINNTII